MCLLPQKVLQKMKFKKTLMNILMHFQRMKQKNQQLFQKINHLKDLQQAKVTSQHKNKHQESASKQSYHQ
jgi:cell fate (sporulation/competence/biofilm development) regulator YmcA (YheA/YmcA/DUF963 family)